MRTLGAISNTRRFNQRPSATAPHARIGAMQWRPHNSMHMKKAPALFYRSRRLLYFVPHISTLDQWTSPDAIASLYTDATRFAITELSKFSRA